MLISLIAKNRISSVSLPEKANGRYWITDLDDSGRQRHVADVEGVQGQWQLHSSAFLSLTDHGGGTVGAVPLEREVQVIKAQYREDGQMVQFYIEPTTEDRQRYSRYCVSRECRLNIGREENNQIVFANKYVSGHHACLVWKDGEWSITDTQSSNGTFVNGERIATKKLKPGDMIYIMGLKIIVGRGLFALNDPDGVVKVSAQDTAKLPMQKREPRPVEYEKPTEKAGFSRSPSIYKKPEPVEIRVDAPPQPQKAETTPMALLMGPALTMGMTAVVMGSVAVYNLTSGNSTLLQALPTVVMSFAMLCGTLLWPTLTRRHDKRIKMQTEQLRQQKYREYLDRVRGHIFEVGLEQKNAMLERFPSVQECVQRALGSSSRLWERSDTQENFLELRLGLGDVPIHADFHFPEQRFSLEQDMLQNDLRRLADEPKLIQQAPVLCSLLSHRVVGITGPEEIRAAFAQGLILQLSVLHSYDEVKLVFFVEQSEQADWAPFRMLPHTWDDKHQNRYWAVTGEDGKALSAHLEQILSQRAAATSKTASDKRPHYVFVVTDLAAAESTAVFRQFLTNREGVGFSCIALGEDITKLPKECSAVIRLEEENAALVDRTKVSGELLSFQRESAGEAEIRQAVSSLANVELEEQESLEELPNMLTFLELYGVGKAEHLNALARWHDNNPVKTLGVPVGVAADGNPLYLDLHEKYHGPHGLVAGMTGSGKSEFIITYILSMAVNYHPEEVSFILIDYKGGGLAGAFENPEAGIHLPHLAGTITNLDGSAVNRALISIQSELRRRQAIFNKARQLSGEGTIDIYKYQRMYRSGMLETPVPHLFIISDEFAELKAQQPEFMAQLISTARIGRSLGVHLILATQKPSGVVDDQIWSNSRFRVCLKVQERADSSEMLKRPDAAELSDTGRFYLQVGFNELFELGQSAWCGAPYTPVDRVEKKRDNGVELIDDLGQVVLDAKPSGESGSEGSQSQIVAIVNYLSQLAKDENVGTRQLWLPPLPPYIYVEQLREKYAYQSDPLKLTPVIGEYDDPANQAQGLLTIPFSEDGNALLYGAAGSGKTTLINAMLCDLIRHYSAEQLNIYILDLGEETLRAFEDAPQVGGVLFAPDQEKTQNLFKMLEDELGERKKLFAGSDGSYESYCKNTGHTLPHILVIIRNYSAFNEQYEELDISLARLTRECVKYGIYFLVVSNAANAVRYRISQNFSTVYSLQLNDPSDYVGLFGNTGGVVPSKIKGRGIFKTDRVYEFQAAHLGEDFSSKSIRELAASLSRSEGATARPVPHLPGKVTAECFDVSPTPEKFPVGIEKASLRNSFLDLERNVIIPILAQDPYELGATVQGVAEGLTRLEGSVHVLDGAGIFELPEGGVGYQYVCDQFAAAVEELFQEAVKRNNTYKGALKKKLPLPSWPERYYVITGLQSILDSLSPEGRDQLVTLIEKSEPEYGIRFLLGDSAKNLGGMSASPWYKKHITGVDGVWVGDGISDQYTLKIGKMTSGLYAELPPHFGYVVKRGKPALVKLIVSEVTEEAEE